MEKEQQSGGWKDSPSGYVERLDDAIRSASVMRVQDGFRDLREFYVSQTGHTRLLYASRYGKLYVLKCLKPDFLYVPLYRQALAKEFEIGLQLDHPCICRTVGMEEVEGLGPVIVMERVDGCTLKNLMEQGALTRPLARRLAMQLMDAVGYLHDRQVIHRDLKPSNIMVSYNGHNVKLIDFSLADSDAFGVLKQPAGTSGYIAPEQLLAGARADVRADIYSLGMVMKDMAQAVGDRQMGHVAALCTRRNVDERPPDVVRLKKLLLHGRRQLFWVVLLALLTLLSALCVAVAWRGRQERVRASQSVERLQPNSNRAVDIRSWPSQQ